MRYMILALLALLTVACASAGGFKRPGMATMDGVHDACHGGSIDNNFARIGHLKGAESPCAVRFVFGEPSRILDPGTGGPGSLTFIYERGAINGQNPYISLTFLKDGIPRLKHLKDGARGDGRLGFGWSTPDGNLFYYR